MTNKFTTSATQDDEIYCSIQQTIQYKTIQDNMRTSQTDEEYPRPTDAMFVVL